MGEIIPAIVEAITGFFFTDKLDRGLRRYRWLRIAGLAVLAIAFGLATGSLLGALI